MAVVSEASTTNCSHPQLENFYFGAKDILDDIVFKKLPCEISKLLFTLFLFSLRLMFPSALLHWQPGMFQ